MSKKFCVLGAGRMGRIHAHNIAASDKAEVAVVVDVDQNAARNLATRVGAEVMTDPLSAITSSTVDVVAIASPEDTHAELIMAAVRAGKPVFCEKPVDTDLRKVDACAKVVETSNVPVFVGFNRRFDPSRWALHQAVRNGEIGKIEMVHITSRDTLETLPYVFLGGMFRNSMSHDFDILRWILGEEPVEIFAYGSCLIDPKIGEMDDVDTAVVSLRTASGVLAHINCSRRAVYGYDQRVEVLGSKGMLQVGNASDTRLARYLEDSTRTDPVMLSFMARYMDAYAREMAYFIDALDRGEPPMTTVEDGRRALLLAFLAIDSLKSGKPVAVDYGRRDFDHLVQVGVPRA